MAARSLRLLAHGVDTAQCAYYLVRRGKARIDFTRLKVLRERLRDSKEREPEPIRLGELEFLLAPSGTGTGYPFVVSNPDFRIAFGELNVPSFFVTYSSAALWREPLAVLQERFLHWAASIGYFPAKPETLSRVDWCFDFHLPTIDFDEDAFVSLSSKDSQHRQDGKVQTFTLGKGDIVLRVYDKVAEIEQQSGKTWFYRIWGERQDVWRIEWQARKRILRRFGIRTCADLAEQHGDLLRYLAHEHDTLRVPTQDSNRSRWPLHPLWLDLQAQIQNLPASGIYRDLGPPAIWNQRLAIIVRSMYGYLKQFAAVQAIQKEQDTALFQDALQHLEQKLHRLHNPMAWDIDVNKRVKTLRLEQ